MHGSGLYAKKYHMYVRWDVSCAHGRYLAPTISGLGGGEGDSSAMHKPGDGHRGYFIGWRGESESLTTKFRTNTMQSFH